MSLEWPARPALLPQRPASRTRHSKRLSGLVESAGVVVGNVDAGQPRQHRGLVRALSRTSRTARRKQRFRHLPDAAALRRLRVRLRLSLGAAARRCAADLPVRHLSVERGGRPLGRDGGRAVLCRAVGGDPVSARQHDRIRHGACRGVDDPAADRHRGMLFLVRGIDHQLSRQRHREFDLGSRLLHRGHRPVAIAAGVRRRGSRGPHRRHRGHRGLSRVSHDRRRADVL